MPVAHEFRFGSRGDWVTGRLWLPHAAGPHPLVLVSAPLGHDTERVHPLCAGIAAGGAAAACFDLPLHGARSSRKLSAERLLAADATKPTPAEAALRSAFRSQVAADLDAARARLVARADLDAKHVACLALEPGAEAAAAWARQQPDLHLLRCTMQDAEASIAAWLERARA